MIDLQQSLSLIVIVRGRMDSLIIDPVQAKFGLRFFHFIHQFEASVFVLGWLFYSFHSFFAVIRWRTQLTLKAYISV